MKSVLHSVGKRLAALLLAVIGLSCFVVSEARADSMYEWNRSCRRKMNQTTTVYSGGDPTRAIDTITAGTYVKVGSQTELRAWITYMKADGTYRSGFVDPSCIGSAVISFTDANGNRQGIQELQYYEMYGNNPPPGGVLDNPLPGGNGETVGTPIETGKTETAESTEKTTTSGSTSATKKSSSTKTTTAKTTATKTTTSEVNTDVLWQGKTVSVKTWGFHSSVILSDGQEQTVPSGELTFSEKVDTTQRIAYIHAPRTGRCYLRSKASDKGDILDKCPAGTIVQVLAYGKSYCQILYDGQVGYVQTACLKFADPAAEPMATAPLSYNGKTTGAAQVPIRNAADNDSSIIVKLRSGTEVTVFSKSGKWYEVEYNGLHGYVHENFMSALENE